MYIGKAQTDCKQTFPKAFKEFKLSNAASEMAIKKDKLRLYFDVYQDPDDFPSDSLHGLGLIISECLLYKLLQTETTYITGLLEALVRNFIILVL